MLPNCEPKMNIIVEVPTKRVARKISIGQQTKVRYLHCQEHQTGN